MAQQHLDRLTSTDAGFLHQETTSAHMHVGGVLLFDGPAPPFEDFLEHIRGRLHLVPRYRQKLAIPPAGSGRPLWVDDSNFNLEYHVRALGAARAGQRGAAARDGGADRLAAARPHQAAVGVLAGRGDRARRRLHARALRDDLQEPPRAGRRRLRDRSGDRAARLQPDTDAARHIRARAVAAAARAERARPAGRRRARRRRRRRRARRARR